jgi:hypothetical protein
VGACHSVYGSPGRGCGCIPELAIIGQPIVITTSVTNRLTIISCDRHSFENEGLALAFWSTHLIWPQETVASMVPERIRLSHFATHKNVVAILQPD